MITHLYAIHKSKIFYLYNPADNQTKLLNQMFDFEDLNQEVQG